MRDILYALLALIAIMSVAHPTRSAVRRTKRATAWSLLTFLRAIPTPN